MPEGAFGIRLPDNTLEQVETVADLLLAAQRADRARAPAPPRAPLPASVRLRDVSPDGATPAGARTLLEVLDWHLHAHPDRTHLTCLEGDNERALSWRQLADAGAAVAAGLQQAVVQPRQCVAIMLPTSP